MVHSDPSDRLTWDAGTVATLHVESPSGIGSARLRKNGREWPEAFDVHLSLKALEGFVIRSGNDVYRLEVTADHRALLEPVDSALELRQTPDSGAQSGYSVRVLPARFAEPSDELVLEWVDYYR